MRPQLAGSASGLSGALTVGMGAILTALPGALLTDENSVWLVMVLMLFMAAAGLASAWYVRILDLREPLPRE